MLVKDQIKHVVILCHPKQESFNAAVAAQYCAEVKSHGQVAVLRDLYRLHFDPILKSNELPGSPTFTPSSDVEEELEIIADAAVLVLIYPIWFGTPPAMLKGYVDRVLGADFTFKAVRARSAASRLEGTHLLNITTSGTSDAWLEEQGQRQSLIQVFDRYLARAFSMASTEHVHFGAIADRLHDLAFRQNIEEVRQIARKSCSITLNDQYSGEAELSSKERAWLRSGNGPC